MFESRYYLTSSLAQNEELSEIKGKGHTHVKYGKFSDGLQPPDPQGLGCFKHGFSAEIIFNNSDPFFCKISCHTFTLWILRI